MHELQISSISQVLLYASMLVMVLCAMSAWATPFEDNARHLYSHEVLLDAWDVANDNQPSTWVEGYQADIDGGFASYGNQISLDRVIPALVVHPNNGKESMAWTTAPVPKDITGKTVTFVWMAGIGANLGDGTFDVLVNGQKRFEIHSRDAATWVVDGDDGASIRFDSLYKDPSRDYFGYIRLQAPLTWLTPGAAATFRITGHNDQCTAYLFTFKRSDAVAYLRGQGRPVMFSQSRVDLDGQGSVFVQAIARPILAGKVVQVMLGNTKVSEGALSIDQGIASVIIQLPLTKPLAEQALKLVLDGKTEGEIQVDPLIFDAQTQLARADNIKVLAVSGLLDMTKTRTAAMLLARAQLLQGIIAEPDERRHGEFYQRAGSIKDALAALAEAFTDYEATADPYPKKRGLFLSAYLSNADASGQIYGLDVPESYKASEAYPLLVALHGSGGSFISSEAPNPPYDSPFLFARVDGRGSGGGYHGLSELDVLEVIADVSKNYHVDPDRISICGHSMGSFGTWSLLMRYPDRFAAGLSSEGAQNGGYLENLLNTPFWYFHDDSDWLPIDPARAAIGYLRPLNPPLLFTTAHGHGHTWAGLYSSFDLYGWMTSQRRNPYPATMHYRTDTAYRGRCFWTEIVEFTNPNQSAALATRVETNAGVQQVFLNLENVEVARLELPGALFAPQRPLSLLISQDPLTVKAPLPAAVYLVRQTDGSYYLATTDPRAVTANRPYTAGGINYMFSSGEPLLIVKGTAGADQALLAEIDRASRDVSTTMGGRGNKTLLGGIPIVADNALTEANIRERISSSSVPAAPTAISRKLPGACRYKRKTALCCLEMRITRWQAPVMRSSTSTRMPRIDSCWC